MEDKINDILSFLNYFIIMVSIKHKLIKIYGNWMGKKGLQPFLTDPYNNQTMLKICIV